MYKIYEGLLEISKEKKNDLLEYVQKHVYFMEEETPVSLYQEKMLTLGIKGNANWNDKIPFHTQQTGKNYAL